MSWRKNIFFVTFYILLDTKNDILFGCANIVEYLCILYIKRFCGNLSNWFSIISIYFKLWSNINKCTLRFLIMVGWPVFSSLEYIMFVAISCLHLICIRLRWLNAYTWYKNSGFQLQKCLYFYHLATIFLINDITLIFGFKN